MFSNKLKTLLALMLVLVITCAFTVFASAEESNDGSDVSTVLETSDGSSDTSAAVSTDDSSDTSDTTSTVSGDTSTESAAATESTVDDSTVNDSSAAEETGSAWTGWIIAGIVIVILALGVFVSIKRNTALGQKFVKWYKDYRSEIKKIVWLSRKETIRQTGIVLVIIIIACIFLGGLDYGFTKLIQLI